jgi:hypothetical protein
MEDVAKHGRTVLFVSHNMPAIKSLCTRAILLSDGQLKLDGAVDEVVHQYLTADSDDMGRTGIIRDDAPRLFGTGDAKLRSVRLTDLEGNDLSQLYLGQPCRLRMSFEVFKAIPDAIIEVGIIAMDGTHVTNSSSIDGGLPPVELETGNQEVTLELDACLLPRQYTFLVAVHHSSGLTIEWIERALDFTVMRVAESGADSYRWPSVRGYLRPTASWVMPKHSSSTDAVFSNMEGLTVGGRN